MNQRSADQQAQTSSLDTLDTVGASVPTCNKSMPAEHRARPTKRASYAGHELSFSDLKYTHDEYSYDSDDSGSSIDCGANHQGTLCTEKTGELTEKTGHSSGITTLAASLAPEEKKLSSIPSPSGKKQQPAHLTFEPLPMPQLHRRVSAPPILGLTVETPSPTTASKTILSPVPKTDNDDVLVSSEDSSIVSVTVEDGAGQQAQTSGTGSSSTTSSIVEPALSPSPAVAAPAPAPPAASLSESTITAEETLPPRRQLRFNPKTRVYLHLHLDDYTDAEYEASFVTDEDLTHIQPDAVQCIHQMRANGANGQHGDIEEDDSSSEEDHRYCSRGLENMASPTVAAAHRVTKAAVRDAVMDEQDRQFLAEIYDEERIAATSISASADSVMEAILRGASDAVFVQRFVRMDVEDDTGLSEDDNVDADEEDATVPQQDEGEVAPVFEAPAAPAAADDNENLSSILQDALNVSMHGENVQAPGPAQNNQDPRPNPSNLTRVGSRERLLDILGQLRSDMAQARTKFQEVTHVVRRDNRRSSSSEEASHSSSSSE